MGIATAMVRAWETAWAGRIADRWIFSGIFRFSKEIALVISDQCDV